MSITLEKIDLVKERSGASYKEARAALEAAGGDVVNALVILEEQDINWVQEGPHKEALNKVKDAFKKSNENKIRIKTKEKTVWELPAPVGALGAVVFPKAAAFGTLLLLFTRYSIHLEKEPGEPREDEQLS